MIPFNKPFISGDELRYIKEAVESGKISGNGLFTQRCHQFFQERYGYHRCLLTSSCTDALEMAALLLDLGPGDEVILPSFTFVSTANAFVLRGATLVFADSEPHHPNMDAHQVAQLITPRTKAIVVVHYAGMSCDMAPILALAKKHQLAVVEDAAQGIDATYEGKPLGGIGDLAAFSFHETKNVMSGEGGMLVINNPELVERAEIIWEKGTNRVAFFKGEVSKYGWVDLGSSFLPSEITAAFLFAQLEHLDEIQARRLAVWHEYHTALADLEEKGLIRRPQLPPYASLNGHLYYIEVLGEGKRQSLIDHLGRADVLAVFHYLPLHQSPFFEERYVGAPLPHCVRFSEQLLRLPLYYGLQAEAQQHIIATIKDWAHAQL
ncbi:MAG: dTDP-4-amino-4,6-dideoxygalactose transaminase [Bacteroidota bacterium]